MTAASTELLAASRTDARFHSSAAGVSRSEAESCHAFAAAVCIAPQACDSKMLATRWTIHSFISALNFTQSSVNRSGRIQDINPASN